MGFIVGGGTHDLRLSVSPEPATKGFAAKDWEVQAISANIEGRKSAEKSADDGVVAVALFVSGLGIKR